MSTNPQLDPELTNPMLDLFGSCMACIRWRCQPLDEEGEAFGPVKTFGATGFAMFFDRYPVLVTAGHVINDMLIPMLRDGALAGNRVKILSCHLLPYRHFGVTQRPGDGIPIDFNQL